VPLFAIERLLREVFRASDESEWLTQAELEVEVQRLLSGEGSLTTAANLAANLTNHPANHPAELAQELAFQALESEDPDRALQLVDGALQLNACCVDALVLRAFLSAEDGAELVDQLGRAAAVGETDLGEEFFSEYMGDFWTLVEARPYLRTLRQLAEVLWDQGRRLDAVAQFEELLDLDPDDHQGNALALLACYLCLGEVGRGLDLLDEYCDPDDATWQWGTALAHYLAGNYRRAERQLSLAKTLNPHVTTFLCGDRDVPEVFSLRPDSRGGLVDSLIRLALVVHHRGRRFRGSCPGKLPRSARSDLTTGTDEIAEILHISPYLSAICGILGTAVDGDFLLRSTWLNGSFQRGPCSRCDF